MTREHERGTHYDEAERMEGMARERARGLVGELGRASWGDIPGEEHGDGDGGEGLGMGPSARGAVMASELGSNPRSLALSECFGFFATRGSPLV